MSKKMTITTSVVKRIGPKKLKSWPFSAAQNVYNVKQETTIAVKTADSHMILPV
jgi:hypothetical protein